MNCVTDQPTRNDANVPTSVAAHPLIDRYLAAIVEGSDDAIVGKTLEGMVTSWNRAAELMFGYKAEEMIGQSITRIIPPDRLHDLRMILGRIRRAERVHHYETARVRKDGQRIDVSLTVSPICNAEGEIVGASKIARDITAHKRTEAALRASEQSLAAFFEASTAGLVQTDVTSGHFVRVNAKFCDITGYTRDELKTMTAEMLMHPEDRIRESERQAGMVSGLEASYVSEYRYVRKDGRVVWVQVGTRLVPQLNRKPTLTAGVVIDITAMKVAVQESARLNTTLESRIEARTRELAEVNRELEAFAYSVSHDLRAPLRSIDGFGDRLMERYADRLDEVGLDYLRRMARASRRMGQLIDDLLMLSRIGRAELSREEVHLSAIAEEVRNDLRAANPERKVAFHLEPNLKDSGDSRLVRILLENLLGNAWKYTGLRTAAEISFGRLSAARTGWIYCVKDNGDGFDMAHSGNLFQPFQRLHRTSEFEGTGIGLAIAHRIVTRHGGRIWAQAEKGKGATFYFTLGA